MPIDKIANSVFLFLVAGLCEIAGGWLIWQWLREGKSIFLGVSSEEHFSFFTASSPPFSPPILVGSMPPMEAFSLFSYLCGAGWSMEIHQTVPT